MKTLNEVSFEEMYNGWYYTITGAGGSLEEWVQGYNEMLDEQGIGTPEYWVTFKGADMNQYYGLTGDNRYIDGLNFLAFPLNGLNTSRLAMFKLKMADRWFNDICDNNARREHDSY